VLHKVAKTCRTGDEGMQAVYEDVSQTHLFPPKPEQEEREDEEEQTKVAQCGEKAGSGGSRCSSSDQSHTDSHEGHFCCDFWSQFLGGLHDTPDPFCPVGAYHPSPPGRPVSGAQM
jgi:hypothetical protein